MRVEFHGDPALSPYGAGDKWKMLSEWFVRVISDEGELLTFAVPAGLITDLASVPRLPLVYLVFGNKARRAAILHDWLYSMRYPRDWSDEVFYLAAVHEGIPKVIASAMWAAVRAGGASRYKEHAE